MSIHACAPVTNGVGKRVKDAVKRVGAAGGRARTLARVGDDDDDDEDDGSVTARETTTTTTTTTGRGSRSTARRRRR